MTVLDRYKKERHRSDDWIAERAGISRAMVSHIRLGHRRPSVEVARKIELATGGEVTAASLLGVTETEGTATAKPLNDGRWFAPIGGDVPVELPAGLLRAFGFEEGDTVIFRRTEDGVLMTSQRKAIRRIQDDLAKLVRSGESVVDELIAERRAEATRE